MKEIKIKVESKLKRCEICHQADMFEQEREMCLRCKDLEKTEINFVMDSKEVLTQDTSREILAISVGLVLAIILGYAGLFIYLVPFTTNTLVMQIARCITVFLFMALGLYVGVRSIVFIRFNFFSLLSRMFFSTITGVIAGLFWGIVVAVLDFRSTPTYYPLLDRIIFGSYWGFMLSIAFSPFIGLFLEIVKFLRFSGNKKLIYKT